MRKLNYLIPVISLIVTTSAIANQFQHEIEIGSLSSSDDFGDGMFNIGYQFYFTPIDDSKIIPKRLIGKYANSNFLYTNYTSHNSWSSYSLGGRYYVAKEWFVQGGYTTNDSENDSDGFEFLSGYHLTELSLLSIKYKENESENSFFDHTVTDWEISYSHFIPLQSTAGIDFSASYNKSSYVSKWSEGKRENDDDLIRVNLDWFINKSWSLGASHIHADSSYSTINTQYWHQFSDGLSINLGAETSINDSDGTLIYINGTYRF
ncbi:hypothetical protein [Thalassotalea sediminis]|uniref:hypothetical protein n=1 Tax=Thalassotalea sediminis TaxID=1759089 RepID=UPI0025735A68|nr:hypothetical protein [Thalassotalea sediminis]